MLDPGTVAPCPSCGELLQVVTYYDVAVNRRSSHWERVGLLTRIWWRLRDAIFGC